MKNDPGSHFLRWKNDPGSHCSMGLLFNVKPANFTLPFTTSMMILISILQTFRSWGATSHLRPPTAFLSHISSDTPGLAPLMNVLFWEWCDFPISFSAGLCKGTFEIVSKEVLTGILSNNMRSSSPEYYTIFWMMIIYIDTLHWSGITPIFDIFTDLDLNTEFDRLPYRSWHFPWIWNFTKYWFQ